VVIWNISPRFGMLYVPRKTWQPCLTLPTIGKQDAEAKKITFQKLNANWIAPLLQQQRSIKLSLFIILFYLFFKKRLPGVGSEPRSSRLSNFLFVKLL
jgi:hypothetical protein